MLELLKNLLTEGNHKIQNLEYTDDFLRMLVNLFEDCFNKETLENLLSILAGVSRDTEARKKLIDLQIFGSLSKFYLEAVENKNMDLLFNLFILVSRFIKDVSFRVYFGNFLDNKKNFDSLSEPFKPDNAELTNNEVKLSVMEIVRNVLLISNSVKMERSRTGSKAQFLKFMVKNCLEGGDD